MRHDPKSIAHPSQEFEQSIGGFFALLGEPAQVAEEDGDIGFARFEHLIGFARGEGLQDNGAKKGRKLSWRRCKKRDCRKVASVDAASSANLRSSWRSEAIAAVASAAEGRMSDPKSPAT